MARVSRFFVGEKKLLREGVWEKIAIFWTPNNTVHIFMTSNIDFGKITLQR